MKEKKEKKGGLILSALRKSISYVRALGSEVGKPLEYKMVDRPLGETCLYDGWQRREIYLTSVLAALTCWN